MLLKVVLPIFQTIQDSMGDPHICLLISLLSIPIYIYKNIYTCILWAAPCRRPWGRKTGWVKRGKTRQHGHCLDVDVFNLRTFKEIKGDKEAEG